MKTSQARGAAREEMIPIPQMHATLARFPRFDRIHPEANASPLHPLLEVASNSSDSHRRGSYFSDVDYPDATVPVEDLGE